ncbi:MAG: hypothetical protein ACOYL6_13425 [Bacteriovoracaceae bacterium]
MSKVQKIDPQNINQEDNLLLRNLSLTPEERIINHQKALNLLNELKKITKGNDAKRS